MAQNPIEGGGTGTGGSGTGLTLSNANFSTLNSVNCNRPEVFGQIADVYLKCYARRSGTRRSGSHSKANQHTEFAVSGTYYTCEVTDMGNQLFNVASTPTLYPAFRIVIRAAVARTVTYDAIFPYASFEGVNWASVSGAVITP